MNIDAEFRELCPPLTDEEYEQLVSNITRYGCREPLVIWKEKGILLDGHNRHAICQSSVPPVPFKIVEISLPNRDAAKDWIFENQLGRRNLAPAQQSYIRGRMYNREKSDKGRPENKCDKMTHFSDEATSPQNEDKPRTSERLSKKLGIAARTIERDGVFADAVDTLKPVVPSIERDVARGDIPSKGAVVAAAKAAKAGRADEAVEKLKPHVAQHSGENEWYTPPEIIAMAKAAMGDIDCDPASCDVANEIVQAKSYWKLDDDGLTHAWHGRVWLNPPYSQPLVSYFCEAVCEKYASGEIEQACVLVNNATETAHFQRMLESAAAVCFPASRIRFIGRDGKTRGNTPLQGQAVLYFGQSFDKFRSAFQKLGAVLKCQNEA